MVRMSNHAQRLVTDAPEVFADVKTIVESRNFSESYKGGEHGTTHWLECDGTLGPYDAVLEERLDQPTPYPVEDMAARMGHAPILSGNYFNFKRAQQDRYSASQYRMKTSENYPDNERTASQRLDILERVKQALQRAPQVPQPA